MDKILGPVRALFDALNRHDIPAFMDLLADDFVWIDGVTSEVQANKEALRSMLGWDVATNARTEVPEMTAEDGRVAVTAVEVNDFLELSGIGPLTTRMLFRVNQQGLITEQTVLSVEPDPFAAVREAIEPVVAWAEVHRAEELAEIYEGGRIRRYDGETGRKWVEMLRGWRAGRAAAGPG